eukprot:155972-Chlamydomonas_euryale.AAC.2
MVHACHHRRTPIGRAAQVSSTYYSRIHIARTGSNEEVDIDARPSDAINLAVRFHAPMYISKVRPGSRRTVLEGDR